MLDAATARHIEAVKGLIAGEVNVKQIELLSDTTGVITKRIKPNFKTLGPKYGKVHEADSRHDGHLHAGADRSHRGRRRNDARHGCQKITVTPADFEITSEDMPGWLVATEGKLTVALDITVTEELRREGVARELINRIQNIRKDSGFEVTDKIRVQIELNDEVEGRHRRLRRLHRLADARRRGWARPSRRVRSFVVDSDVNDKPLRIAVTRVQEA